MNSLRLLTASFVAVPFLVVICYFLPQDAIQVVMEVVIGGGLLCGLVLAAFFVVSTVLGAIRGGPRRR
jgi:hypothetical protein